MARQGEQRQDKVIIYRPILCLLNQTDKAQQDNMLVGVLWRSWVQSPRIENRGRQAISLAISYLYNLLCKARPVEPSDLTARQSAWTAKSFSRISLSKLNFRAEQLEFCVDNIHISAIDIYC